MVYISQICNAVIVLVATVDTPHIQRRTVLGPALLQSGMLVGLATQLSPFHLCSL